MGRYGRSPPRYSANAGAGQRTGASTALVSPRAMRRFEVTLQRHRPGRLELEPFPAVRRLRATAWRPAVIPTARSRHVRSHRHSRAGARRLRAAARTADRNLPIRPPTMASPSSCQKAPRPKRCRRLAAGPVVLTPPSVLRGSVTGVRRQAGNVLAQIQRHGQRVGSAAGGRRLPPVRRGPTTGMSSADRARPDPEVRPWRPTLPPRPRGLIWARSGRADGGMARSAGSNATRQARLTRPACGFPR